MFVSLQFKIELKKNRLVPLSAGGDGPDEGFLEQPPDKGKG